MFEKIILITQQTRLDELIERFNTQAQAKFYIERAGGDFAAYVLEHDAYPTPTKTDSSFSATASFKSRYRKCRGPEYRLLSAASASALRIIARNSVWPPPISESGFLAS